MPGYTLKYGKERRGDRRRLPRPESPERRRTYHVVTFATDQPILPAVEWLEENCTGIWDVRLVGFEDADFTRKIIQVMFEDAIESDRFVVRFGSRHCVCKILAA